MEERKLLERSRVELLVGGGERDGAHELIVRQIPAGKGGPKREADSLTHM